MLAKIIHEANYLIAIINSHALSEAVAPLMPKGQFGARHLQKHLWRLSIPEFDPALKGCTANITKRPGLWPRLAAQTREAEVELHVTSRGDELTVAIARRELRKWLRISDEGKAVESAVGKLLAGG